MEEHDRRAIQKCYMNLDQDLEVDQVARYLHSEGLFTWEDLEKINESTTRNKKVFEFIGILRRRGPKAFELFLEALEKTEQSHIKILLLMARDDLISSKENIMITSAGNQIKSNDSLLSGISRGSIPNGNLNCSESKMVIDSPESHQITRDGSFSLDTPTETLLEGYSMLNELSTKKNYAGGKIRATVLSKTPAGHRGRSGNPFLEAYVRDNKKTCRRLLSFGTVADTFSKEIKADKAYDIENFTVREPDARFNSDPVEIIIDKNSVIKEVNPPQFYKINEVLRFKQGTIISTKGKIEYFDPPKVNNNLYMRKIFINDETASICVSIIGDKALNEPKIGTNLTILYGNLGPFGKTKFIKEIPMSHVTFDP